MLWRIVGCFCLDDVTFAYFRLIVRLILLFLYILPFLINKATFLWWSKTLSLKIINNRIFLLFLWFLIISFTFNLRSNPFDFIQSIIFHLYLSSFNLGILFIKLISNSLKNMIFVFYLKLILLQKNINLLLQHGYVWNFYIFYPSIYI